MYDFDTTKLAVNTLDVGLAGIEVYDILRDYYDIQTEFGDLGNLLAYVSVGDRERDLERLVAALADIRRRYKRDKATLMRQEYISPQVVAGPQEAFYADKQSVALDSSVGRICAEFVMCYPPGIPILAPGERITRDILDYIRYAKEKNCMLLGTEDPEVNSLQVIRGVISRNKRSVFPMQLTFTEMHTPTVGLQIQVDRQLHTEKSDFQRIDVFECEEFGRFLTLDGYMMLTERDEFIYHEMMVHVPLAVLGEKIKKVLVIGGGDGGCVRELCRYKHIEHIDLVEIDERVVAVCKEYLPGVACSLDDPRVHILYQDGLKYIRRIEDEYDLIIIDSTDPFGPGEGLFTMEFYGNCYKALHEHGVLVNQHESPFYRGDALACQRAHRNIVHSFELSRLFQAHIPTYPSGHWLFGFSSRGVHPVRDLNPDWWNSLGLETGYYNTNLHKGAFYLPNYVQKLLEKVEE